MNEFNMSADEAQAETTDNSDSNVRPIERPDPFDWPRRVIVPGQVVELFARNVLTDEGDEPVLLHGYFDYDHLDDFIREAASLSGAAGAVYWMPNPVDPALMATAPNRIQRCFRRPTDENILHRRWMLVDIDAVGKGKQSATDAEKAATLATGHAVRVFTRSLRWPDPLFGDSGNGVQLLYRIDLPPDDGGLVERVLHAMATRFDTERAKIDTSVGNAARPARLFGTMNCKGEDSEERPHRESAVLDLPEKFEAVTKEQLEALAGEFDPPKRVAKPAEHPAPVTLHESLTKRLRRAQAYMAKVPPAVTGEHGDPHTFTQACRMIRMFGLSPDEAYPVLAEWNERCVPPWPAHLLRRKLTEALKRITEEGGGTELGGVDGGGQQPPDSPTGVVCSDHDDDPHGLANAFLTARCRNHGGLSLRYWKGAWWRWKDGRYRQITGNELGTEVTAALPALLPRPNAKYKGVAVTQKRVGDVLGALAGMCAVPSDTEQPAWLGNPDSAPPGTVISVRNGLLVLNAEGAGELIPASRS
jgi:hypothetical protein